MADPSTTEPRQIYDAITETPTSYERVPDGIDPLDAAPLTCAGVTMYKAVAVAGTRSTDLVAVFGVGGLGHLAIQYAVIAGARVVAVDLLDEKLDLARELGAEFTVNALSLIHISEPTRPY